MRHAVLDGAPLLIAHRGGGGLAPENTLAAFENGAHVWGADMIELDVQSTVDGHCVVMHDDDVDRTTSGTGAVAGMTLGQLQRLDAGHHFTRDGGRTFPFRERGVRVPTLHEVLEALPGMRFTVEVKAGAAQTPMFETIRHFNARDRVIVAGMYERDRTQFVDYRGAVSASGEELKAFLYRHAFRMGRFTPPRADVVQTCESYEGRRIVTPRFVRTLRARGIPVHVWTVNDPADMNRLLDWGVEGLLSDFPDVLGRVLHERVGRPLAPGHLDAGSAPA
ncbi:MAG TPA: glycerophosphodiester phosphodiesterase [Longimicrobiales bacterium]|nr:glycerophosphodiester phosphodiesterase [Longimicrobiales bacterium]